MRIILEEAAASGGVGLRRRGAGGPSPTEAEQRLIVPGLRANHYLCFFGMHVLTPAVMDLLGEDETRNCSSRCQPFCAAKSGRN